jgi:uncharacterized membrane protein YphA (DoxX/SURF4 family)
MLTTFPSLLAYNFFVPMLLRVVVALFFASLAINHFKAKKELATELEHHFKFLSHETSIWVSGLLILAELGVGILLFVGAWTQIAAILAALGFAKMSYFAPSMPRYAPLPRSTYMLLIAISISLLITGAGAFAFDLPL